MPRADLLLELANDGDARRGELGRGQCGARRERHKKREQVRWGREARQGADASFTTERGAVEWGMASWEPGHGASAIAAQWEEEEFHEEPPGTTFCNYKKV